MYSATLLAAGESSRMGHLKALLPWGGSSLIERQIEQVAYSQIAEIVVVLGFKHELLHPIILNLKEKYHSELKINIITNHHYQLGKTTSIRTGMKMISTKSKGIVILGVDQPVICNTLDQLLCDLKDGEIRIPVFEGRNGHPIMLSSTFYGALFNITEKNKGLRGIIAKYPNDVRYVEVHEPQVLINLNYEQDYLKAKKEGLDNYHFFV